jgi:hypothetical protein
LKSFAVAVALHEFVLRSDEGFRRRLCFNQAASALERRRSRCTAGVSPSEAIVAAASNPAAWR